MDLYKACKDMPNPSRGLLELFRRHRYQRIWVYRDHYKRKDFCSLNKLKRDGIDKAHIMIGFPCDDRDESHKKEAVQAKSYTGSDVRRAMFQGSRKELVYTVGLGTKGKPVWFLDKTEEIVKGLNEIGACFLSRAHCDLVQISPKVQQCKYCKRKVYKRIVVSKNVRWLTKEAIELKKLNKGLKNE